MSVATAIRPPAAIYREEQYFSWWLYVLLAMMVAVGWLSVVWGRSPRPDGTPVPAMSMPLSVVVGLVLPPVLVVGVLRMTTEVSPDACRVWFGIVPTYRREIRVDAIKSVEVVRYRPFRDHLFWGVRTTRDGERVFTARGDRGVRLQLVDGTRVLIGSQRPEELAASLQAAIQPLA